MFIVLDTETAPVVKRDFVNGADMAVYDAAWVVGDPKETAVTRNFLVSEIFYNSSLMQSAYYAEKIPQYEEMIKAGTITVASFFDVWQQFKADVKEYNAKKVLAFNSSFDKAALNATIQRLSNGYQKSFVPYGCKWVDIRTNVCSTIGNTRKYADWCILTGNVTEKGNPKTSVESFVRYLFNDEYIESHTALNDAIDEMELYRRFKQYHKKENASGKTWQYPKQYI